MRTFFVCLVAAAAAVAAEPQGSIPRITYGPGRELAKLANRQINESSGLAASRLNRGVFWTHNDSGSAPRLFAFNAKGEGLATLEIKGAAARDWEDMASFSRGRRHFLLVGDVGDNNARRKDCVLYVVPEPRVHPKKRGQRKTSAPLQTIRFRYEDGSHNCESVAIDPRTRTIYLVSKVGGGTCKAYALGWPTRSGTHDVVAKPVATLKIPTATAMDISPDGLRAVVLTYGSAYEYVRRPKEGWAEGFARAPRAVPMPPRVQGESLCYGRDGKTLYLTSECKGKDSTHPSPLFEVPVAKETP
jgi:hypothetical protein